MNYKKYFLFPFFSILFFVPISAQPAPVSNLTAVNRMQVTLQWTSVSDISSGRAEIKFSSSAENFADMPDRRLLSYSAVSGTTVQLSLSGLVPFTSYYFQLKISSSPDGEYSDLSNKATGYAGLFYPVIIENLGSAVLDIKTEDINGNGSRDIIAAVSGAENKIFYNSLSGLATGQVFTTGADNAQTILSGDLDNDGRADIITLDPISGSIRIYRNNNGQLQLYGTPISDPSVKLGYLFDFDRDGLTDLIAGYQTALRPVKLYKNKSAFEFEAFAASTDSMTVYDIKAADLDNEGSAEIIIGNAEAPYIKNYKTLQNSLTEYFRSTEASGKFTRGVGLLDVNKDGHTDIYSGKSQFYSFVYYNSSGVFSEQQTDWDSVLDKLIKCLTYDIDNDGLTDIVKIGTDGIRVMKNSGGQTFSEFFFISPIPGITSASMADLDLDGDLDIVIGAIDGTLAVLYSEQNRIAPNGSPAAITVSTAFYSGGRIKIEWEKPSDPENQELYYKLWISSSVSFEAGTTVKTGNPGSIESSELPHTTFYYFAYPSDRSFYYRLKAVDSGGGESAGWAGFSGNTHIPPSVINNLTALRGGRTGEIILGWTAPGDDGTAGQSAGYEIRLSSTGLDNSNYQAAEIYAVQQTTFSYGSYETMTLTGLQPVNYYFAVQAFDDTGNYSGIGNTAVNTPADFRNTTGLYGTAVSSSRVLWRWNDNSNNETGYEIRDSSGNLKVSLLPDTTWWMQTGLTPNTLSVINLYTLSSSSAAVSAAQAYSGPGTPLLYPDEASNIIRVRDSSVILSWQQDNSALYAITYSRTEYEPLAADPVWTILKSSAAGITSPPYTVTGLVPSTTYFFKISGYNNEMLRGEETTALKVITKNIRPDSPQNLIGYPISGGKVILQWTPSQTSTVGSYNIYYSSVGIIDYLRPNTGRVNSYQDIWESDSLQTGTEYVFSVRAVDTSGTEDENTNIVKIIPAGNPEAVGYLRYPECGARIHGNSVSMEIELRNFSSKTISEAGMYYSRGSQDIFISTVSISSNTAITIWDTSLLADGSYYIRLFLPGIISPALQPSVLLYRDSQDPEIYENKTGSLVEKNQKIYAKRKNEVILDYGQGFGFRFIVPAAAITADTRLDMRFSGTNQNTGSLDNLIPAKMYFSASRQDGLKSFDAFKKMSYRIEYPDIDGDDIVDNCDVPEFLLSLLYFDIPSGMWKEVYSRSVDRRSNIISGEIDHLTDFGLFGQVKTGAGEVNIFPNPWKPGLGQDFVRFINLPSNAGIKIYTVSGQLVRRFEGIKFGEERWDTRNDAGEKTATGIYYAVITTPLGEKAVQKIVIIR